jgi:hypothetical protein
MLKSYTIKIIILLLAMHGVMAIAQPRNKLPVCGTVPSFEYHPNAVPVQQSFTQPYLLKLFVRIFADADGTNQTTTVKRVQESVAEMNGQYRDHNICFMLVGIDVIRDTYANRGMVYDSLLDNVYKPYLKKYAYTDMMTIFLHQTFVNSGSSGNAYDIPNTFLSVAGWAINDAAGVHSIFGHEMGHCLGLYHTFQAWPRSGVVVYENVTRNPQNACYNAATEGDFCSDTPADTGILNNKVNNACVYSGLARDGCNTAYSPSVINIMSYMPWNCIATTGAALTAVQTNRISATINDVNMGVYKTVAPDNLTVSANESLFSGEKNVGVRNDLSLNASSVTYGGSAKYRGVAGNSVVLKPGVLLSPGAGGLSELRIQPVCQ